MKNKELKAWEKQKKMIPTMIKMYCHHTHHTKGNNICTECKELTEYALFRLEKCPFKKNKSFCSTCKVHCYTPENREKIKKVMRYSGPMLLFSHPVYAMSHVVQTIKYKRKLKKENKNK